MGIKLHKKRKSKNFRLLKENLRYWQTRYRIEARGLLRTKEKIKKIGKMMRKENEQ